MILDTGEQNFMQMTGKNRSSSRDGDGDGDEEEEEEERWCLLID